MEIKTYKNIFNANDQRNWSLMNADLKWPFVGKRFDGVQWHTQKTFYEESTTDIQVQKDGCFSFVFQTINERNKILIFHTQLTNHYDAAGNIDVTTRLITIRPWALIVNTTGQLISLYLPKENIVVNLRNMSVVVPPIAMYNVREDQLNNLTVKTS